VRADERAKALQNMASGIATPPLAAGDFMIVSKAEFRRLLGAAHKPERLRPEIEPTARVLLHERAAL